MGVKYLALFLPDGWENIGKYYRNSDITLKKLSRKMQTENKI